MKGSSLFVVAIFVIAIYALMILPQKKQRKQKALMMSKLAPGAKVMTVSGIYAQVVEMHDDVIVAKIASDVEVEMDSRAVVRIVEQGSTDVNAYAKESDEPVAERMAQNELK